MLKKFKKRPSKLEKCYSLDLVKPSSLGQSHASAYRTSLSVYSTTINYSAYMVILGVCLRFKPHWIFQIYIYVIKGREELISCSSLVHSYLLPLLDVLYGQFSKYLSKNGKDMSSTFFQKVCIISLSLLFNQLNICIYLELIIFFTSIYLGKSSFYSIYYA